MKFIGYNIIPICLIGLAALQIFLNRDGWGWCILAAVMLAVFPETDKD